MKLSELEEKWKDTVPGIVGAPARFAVLVPLVEQEGRTHVLFEVRSRNVTQPGEVCFPGGHMEPGEDAETCALRETEEELGIPRSAIRPIAALDTLVTGRGVISPLLAEVEAWAAEAMEYSPEEVAETFLVPVEFFLEEAPKVFRFPMNDQMEGREAEFYRAIGFPEGYPIRRGLDVQPVWIYENHIIWGLTAKILFWTFRREEWSGPVEPTGKER